MALNSSGPISLAGATAGQSIAVELGVSSTGQISLNDANVRTLAAVPSGAIIMPTNFYGKSSAYTTFTLGTAVQMGSSANDGFASAAVLSSTSAIIFYNGNVDNKSGTISVFARYITVSGTTITANSQVTLFSSINQDLGRIRGATGIDGTYALLSRGSGGLNLIKLTGTTPAVVGSALFGGSATAVGRTHGILTSTTYLAGLADWVGGFVKAAVVTRSGDTISSGTIASVSTGGVTANSGYSITSAAGSSTTAIVMYNNRAYPVTVSGTTATIGGGFLTAPGYYNAGSGVSKSSTTNRYLVSGNGLSGDNVGVQIVDQSGTSLSGGTTRNFGFIAGRVPANSFCKMMANSSSAAAVTGEFGNPFVINISGTTISATKTNMVSTDSSNGGTFDTITTTQAVLPIIPSNTRVAIGTAS
jgi:hypothetical protein